MVPSSLRLAVLKRKRAKILYFVLKSGTIWIIGRYCGLVHGTLAKEHTEDLGYGPGIGRFIAAWMTN